MDKIRLIKKGVIIVTLVKHHPSKGWKSQRGSSRNSALLVVYRKSNL